VENAIALKRSGAGLSSAIMTNNLREAEFSICYWFRLNCNKHHREHPVLKLEVLLWRKDTVAEENRNSDAWKVYEKTNE
jgi:hypothetical protein